MVYPGWIRSPEQFRLGTRRVWEAFSRRLAEPGIALVTMRGAPMIIDNMGTPGSGKWEINPERPRSNLHGLG